MSRMIVKKHLCIGHQEVRVIINPLFLKCSGSNGKSTKKKKDENQNDHPLVRSFVFYVGNESPRSVASELNKNEMYEVP